MSFTLTQLKVQKKTSAYCFEPSSDRPETSQKDLGIETVAGYLAGAPGTVVVEVSPDDRGDRIRSENHVHKGGISSGPFEHSGRSGRRP
jgi:hypothetical protein